METINNMTTMSDFRHIFNDNISEIADEVVRIDEKIYTIENSFFSELGRTEDKLLNELDIVEDHLKKFANRTSKEMIFLKMTNLLLFLFGMVCAIG